MKTYFFKSGQLPLVIEPSGNVSLENFLRLLDEQKDFFKEALLSHGGVLFRNFPIDTETLISCIQHLRTGDFVDYVGGDSPRIKVKPGVYTSTEAPPYIKIGLHSELSFASHYPDNIYFFCETPPQKHGETIIADARKIYKALPEDLKRRFEEKGLKYISRYPGSKSFIRWVNPFHKSWQEVFETDRREEMEAQCKRLDITIEWHRKEWVELTQTRPATHFHPITQEKVWFNQAHLFDFNPKWLGWSRYVGLQLLYLFPHTKLHQVFFGDGTPIPQKDLYTIIDTLNAHTVHFPWKKGDLLLLDNVLAMHGRATFTGKRRILTAMTTKKPT